MAQHLYIAGADRWRDLQKGSLEIQAALTYEIDTCRFDVKGAKPIEGTEVIIEDDAYGRLFAGIVVVSQLTKSLRTAPGVKTNVWHVECNDYTELIDRRLVVETYENVSASEIFADIVTKYCPDFSASGILPDAPVVEYIVFNYKYPTECFKELCDYTGWSWQPDYFKTVHFFNPAKMANYAPMELRPGGPFRFGGHVADKQGLRNRVFVLGGKFLGDYQDFAFVADGVQRVWVLPHEPHSPWVLVGDASATPIKPGLENVDDESEYAWMYNQREKYIRCSSHTATPPTGTTVIFRYKPPMDVVTMVEDLTSQQKLAAIQGGDGVYEHRIIDDTLITIEAAEAAGCADLREHADPKVSGNFETEFVTAEKIWRPGQIVPINLPDRGIQGEYLIQRVTIRRSESFDKWTFAVEYGGRLSGIADFLRAMVSAQQKKNLAEVNYLSKYVPGEEAVDIVDEWEVTPCTTPWICGDADAICGEIVCLASEEE